MPPKKTGKNTHKDLTERCAITGQAKYPGSITKAEQVYIETCKKCLTHYPGGIKLRGYAGIYICDHCDDNYYDPEITGEDDERRTTIEFFPRR